MSNLQHIVLDTNHFFRDPGLEHAVWCDLVAAHSQARIKLHVREMVIREQVRHQDDPNHRELNKHIQDLNRSGRYLKSHGFDVPDFDVEAMRKKRRTTDVPSEYEKTFRGQLEDAGVSILPLPQIDTTDLVESYLQGKKPFKESGEGLADYVIWKSIVELHDATPDDESILVVTANTSDFVKDRAIHPDLHDGIHPARFSWYLSAKQAVQHLSLSRLSTAVEESDIDVRSDFALAVETAVAYASTALSYQEISGRDHPYGDVDIIGYEPPPIFESPTIDNVDLDELSASWNPYDVLEDGTVLGRLEVPAHIGVGGYAYKSDLAITPGITVVNGDHNDHMSEVADEVEVLIEFHIRITGEEAEVLNIESIEVKND